MDRETEKKQMHEARGKEYGSFRDMSQLAQALKTALVKPHMSPYQRESMELICTKLARIACGNPDNRDSWVDIAGYANLVVIELDRPSELGYTRDSGTGPALTPLGGLYNEQERVRADRPRIERG